MHSNTNAFDTPPAGTAGTVYLIGAGPGAADLLTLRAARLIAKADVVLHDALVGPEILELAERAEIVDVGKRCAKASAAQRFINRRLVECARRHRVVVRLKGGDPMLFGRAQEEIDALNEAGIAFEVVPGVSAAFAAAAQIGCPLTVRGTSRSVAFVTPRFGDGERGNDNWLQAAAAADTAAIYMAGRQLPEIAAALIGAGLPAQRPVALVANASLPQASSQALTLAQLRDAAVDIDDGPALLLVGEQLAQLQSNTARPAGIPDLAGEPAPSRRSA